VQIVLNFRTAHYNTYTNVLIKDRKSIAKSYITGWFTIDVLSILPFELMLTSDSFGLVRLLKGARVHLQTLHCM
jgi:hypothetical protein